MTPDDWQQLLSPVDDPIEVPASFEDELWNDLETSIERRSSRSRNRRDRRARAGPLILVGAAAALLLAVVLVAVNQPSTVTTGPATESTVPAIGPDAACERFAPAQIPRGDLEEMSRTERIEANRIEELAGALAVLVTDLETSGAIPAETLRELSIAQGTLDQVILEIDAGDEAAAASSLRFAIGSLVEASEALPESLADCIWGT